MAERKARYTLCKARYADPSSPKYGTVDYSIVMNYGELAEIQLYPCFSGDNPHFDITDSESFNLLFKAKASRMGGQFEILCVDDLPFHVVLRSIHDDIKVIPLDKRHVFLDNVEACFEQP